MKLRAPLPPQQLLFAAAFLLLVTIARSQDEIVTSDNQHRFVKIVGVSASGQTLDIQVGQGQLGLPLSSVKEVRMAAPAEFNQAIAAYQAKDFEKALSLTKTVVGKFHGMPAPWAQQAMAMLGELYIATKDMTKAEAAYADFKRFYPAGGSLQSDVGISRIAVARQDFDTARQKIAPITEDALKQKQIPPGNAIAYSQAFLVSGEVKEAANDLQGALEDYLRTVTLFYADRVAVGEAQDKADALRKAHPEVTVP